MPCLDEDKGQAETKVFLGQVGWLEVDEGHVLGLWETTCPKTNLVSKLEHVGKSDQVRLQQIVGAEGSKKHRSFAKPKS